MYEVNNKCNIKILCVHSTLAHIYVYVGMGMILAVYI